VLCLPPSRSRFNAERTEGEKRPADVVDADVSVAPLIPARPLPSSAFENRTFLRVGCVSFRKQKMAVQLHAKSQCPSYSERLATIRVRSEARALRIL
jgi:hypothetical protein